MTKYGGPGRMKQTCEKVIILNVLFIGKLGKDIPNNLKYTKWPQNIQNRHKIDQMGM
jgi:hypothetical protein